MDDDHTPAVPSPLNPEPKKVHVDEATVTREKRTKKDSLKKRESKGLPDSARATPDPKPEPPIELAPVRYKLAHPRPTDFDVPRGPVFTPHHEVHDPEGRTIEFCETSDHVYNKKSFHYTHCIADPTFPSIFYYRNTEPPPYGPHLAFEDAASHMFFDRSGMHVTSEKGFRMTRANVAVREGRWYWECRVTRGILKDRREGDPESHGHVRVGWARREASLDAPVGFDAYSYGLRDVGGQKVHMSRPKDFFPPGEAIREGDVIGLEIRLPSERLQRKVARGEYNPAIDASDEPEENQPPEVPDVIRDRIPIRFKAHIYFEKIDYHTTKELEDLMNPSPSSNHPSAEPPNPNHRSPALRTLPGSYIRVYKNGVLMGTPWTDLLSFLPPASRQAQPSGGRDALDDGTLGYYPAVSVFRGGAVEVNFGPNFWFPPPAEDAEMGGVPESAGPGRLRPVCERYDEQIVEDIVYDIVDEVGFWIQDGQPAVGRPGTDGKAEATVPGRDEIKELVQDD
ncbi:hypothetical protein VTJ49DRAFT_4042 [Mycothermus thermophilus]|uniref:B30.2/SPRY domain-containing protein n=1 Tax=Humicola insolens TaxID=85995 RepID=A0ABR3V6A9_HUMIN